eukprot:5915984-Amphidinium_carterae.1
MTAEVDVFAFDWLCCGTQTIDLRNMRMFQPHSCSMFLVLIGDKTSNLLVGDIAMFMRRGKKLEERLRE